MKSANQQFTRRAILIASYVVLGAFVCDSQPASLEISGTLEDAAGKRVIGGFVKVVNQTSKATWIVSSGTEGTYKIPGIAPGVYMIQAYGADWQSETVGPLDMRAGSHGIALKMTIPFSPVSIPEGSADSGLAAAMPDGPAKGAIVSRCTTCHRLQWVLSARKTPAEWKQTVERMRDNRQGSTRPLNEINGEEDLIRLDNIASYLAKNFGPDTLPDPRTFDTRLISRGGPSHPNRNIPVHLIARDVRIVSVEKALPPGVRARDMAVDQQGTVWLSEGRGGKLGKFDPQFGTYSQIPLPQGQNVDLDAIATDSEGSVWLVDEGPDARLLQYAPSTGVFVTYALPRYPFPLPPDAPPAQVVTLRFSGPDVWGATGASNWLLKVNRQTRKVEDYSVPKGSSPFGLAIGGKGQVWYAGEVANSIGRLNPETGRLSYYNLPMPRAGVKGMAVDRDGHLWAAEVEAGKLLNIDPNTNALTELDIPNPKSGPFSIDTDLKHGYVWTGEVYGDKLLRLDPATGRFDEFPAAESDLEIRRIVVDPSNPNRVWWCANAPGKIGYVEVIP